MDIDPNRQRPTEIWRTVTRLHDEICRIKSPFVLVHADGSLEPHLKNTWSRDNTVVLRPASARSRSTCARCNKKSILRWNEYGRVENLCEPCLKKLKIHRLREEVLTGSITEAIGRILQESDDPAATREEMNLLWDYHDQAVVDRYGSSILYPGSLSDKWAYEMDRRSFYYRCLRCRGIMKTSKSGFDSVPGSWIAVPRDGHCRTCSICCSHAQISFERKKKFTEKR